MAVYGVEIGAAIGARMQSSAVFLSLLCFTVVVSAVFVVFVVCLFCVVC